MVHVSRTQIAGPVVSINCPKCYAKAVPSSSYTIHEVANFIFRHTSHWVQCGACRIKLQSNCPTSELTGKTPEQLEANVSFRVSFVTNFVSVLAMIFCLAPILGQILCVSSWLLNRNRRGWRIASQIGLLLGILLLVWIYGMEWLQHSRQPHRIK